MKTLNVGREQNAIGLFGHGIKIHVKRGHLVLEDGIADEREKRRVPRASRSLSRIVMHGDSGYVTFDALRWMKDTGIQFVHLGRDHEVVSIGDIEPDIHLSVLRKQLETAGTKHAFQTAQRLLVQKVKGQLSVLEILDPESVADFVIYPQLIRDSGNEKELLSLEGKSSQRYWAAWKGLPLHVEDPHRVPEHWLSFQSRMSNLSKNARYAVDPINAILNYLYQLLYVEATLTLRTIGLDPRIGVFHVEIIGRNSLACDIMEAVRPEVDRWVLTYLRERVFSSAEFFETREGQCRLMPDVAGDLVRTMPEWSEACWKVAKPVYEQLVGKRVRRRG